MKSQTSTMHGDRELFLTKCGTKWRYEYFHPICKRTVRVYYYKFECSQCGKPRFFSRTRDPKTKHSFCSHECKVLFLQRENHPGWKGGFTHQNGHRMIRAAWHPNAKKGYVREHTVVAEEKIGRLLNKSEVVHHIDCDKLNNDPKNLCVMTCGQHASAHQSVNGLIQGLLKNGIISFDSESLTYKSIYGEIDIAGQRINTRARANRAKRIAEGRPIKKRKRGGDYYIWPKLKYSA